MKSKVEQIRESIEKIIAFESEEIAINNQEGKHKGEINYDSEQEKSTINETNQKNAVKKEVQEREEELQRIERENVVKKLEKQEEKNLTSESINYTNYKPSKKKSKEIEL